MAACAAMTVTLTVWDYPKIYREFNLKV